MNTKFVSCGLLMGFLLVSCQPSGKPARQKIGDKNPGPPALDQVTLKNRADGLFYQTGTDKPYTGSNIEPDVKKAKEENRLGFVVVTPYKDGRIHGTMKISYPTGDLQEERVYEAGTLTAPYTINHGKIATVHAESPAQKEDRLKKSGSGGNPVP